MKKGFVWQIMLLVLSVALCVGVKLVFHACAVEDESAIMACHWAEQAVFAFSIVLVAESLLAVLLPKFKQGLMLAVIPTAVLTACIPSGFIRLCMMDTMRCRAVFRPAVLAFAVLLIVCAVCTLLFSRERKE